MASLVVAVMAWVVVAVVAVMAWVVTAVVAIMAWVVTALVVASVVFADMSVWI